ncbi:MAG: tyrosine-type recombinase/integrase [Candidatus Micrarchaeota archaeon]|nr:tyrosine-type recombinase/integrase [Candidatus Micrarchaeota archaeon]
MGEFDIHRQKRTLEKKLAWLQKTKSVSPADKKLIFDFDQDNVARGLSLCRRIKYLILLSQLSKMINMGLRKATKKQIKEVVVQLEQSKYSEWTKKDYKVTLKFFYKWLEGGEDYPDRVKWIKASFKNSRTKLPEDLLTEDEVKRLADAAEHPRDRAFVLALFESGCRIAELLTLRIKNIHFDEYGAVLHVVGKMGDRRVRIVASAPSLASWLDIHPKRSDPECPLWLSRASKTKLLPFNYSTANVLLRRLAEKAGIDKRVNPHLFRHSRATLLANKLTEAQMKEYFGWVQASDMAAVYVHLSGRDVDTAILQLHGLDSAEGKNEKFVVKRCPRCASPGSPSSQICTKCGAALNSGKNQQAQLKELLKDKETLEFLAKRMDELRL